MKNPGTWETSDTYLPLSRHGTVSNFPHPKPYAMRCFKNKNPDTKVSGRIKIPKN